MYPSPPPAPTTRQRWWRGFWRPPTPRPIMWLTLVLTVVIIGVLGTRYQVLTFKSLSLWGLFLVLVGMACAVVAEVFPPTWVHPAGILRIISALTWPVGMAIVIGERLLYAMR